MEVSLRRVTQDDVGVFYEHQLEPEGIAVAAFTPRDRDAHFEHWDKILNDGSIVARAIDADGEVAGDIVSWFQDGHREIGYWIGKAHWGKGIATKAVKLFLEEVPYRPLDAWVAEHNAGSIRVLEKCGFVERDRPPPDERGVQYVVMTLEERS